MNSPVRSISSLDLAGKLMALGLSVIPTWPWDAVKPPEKEGDEPEHLGKKAGIKWKGFRDCRATPEELRRWFSGEKGSQRNVAIVCGPLSDLVVVDADSPEAIEWARKNLPATPWEVSTGKGIHFYYRHPGEFVSNRVRILGIALDLRGDRGYVLAPGSLHPSGRVYVKSRQWSKADEVPRFDPTWIPPEEHAKPMPPRSPQRERPADAPTSGTGWALDATERAWRFMRTVPTKKAGEGRNDARFKLACALVRGFNLPDEETLRALQDWNARCPGPVSDADLWTSIQNAHTSGGEAYGARLAEAPRTPLRTLRPKYAGQGDASAKSPQGASVPQEGPPVPDEPPPPPEWPDEEEDGGEPWLLFRDALRVHKGELRRWEGNLTKILRQDPRWGRRIALNLMTQEIAWDERGDGNHQPTPEQFPDQIQERIEDVYGLSFSGDLIAKKLRSQAVENPYHPVRRYLESLMGKWDGEPRIESIPPIVLGAEDPLACVFMRKFCIGAVRRAMEPGCKMDNAVVLVGIHQGQKKSTFWKTLAGREFFSDTPVELDSKDRFFQVNAAWVIELAEVDGMNSNVTAEAVKQFMSSEKDTFRPPYARTPITLQRSSICVGTTNKDAFLYDATGNRRFWPIRIDLPEGSELNIRFIELWRDQIWAEALHYWAEGEAHYLTKEQEADCRVLTARFEAEDALEGALSQAIKTLREKRVRDLALWEAEARPPAGAMLGGPSVMREERPLALSDGWTSAEILLSMGIPAGQIDKGRTQRVTALLRRRGWRRDYPTIAGERLWRWHDPADLVRELAS